MTVPGIELNDGRRIPQLGFGVAEIDDRTAVDTVRSALDVGYRHIDTAQLYGNEEGVGKAIAASGIPRDELWVTTKLHVEGHSREEAVKRLDHSLELLGLDHVDLYLIHWPLPRQDRYVQAWEGLELAQQAGKARSIGVSNFQVAHLTRLAEETTTVPAVNQIELHPYLPQRMLREHHRRQGIATQAWGPIGQGGELLRHPELSTLARSHGKTPAQIVLRWHIQLGNIVFPKSNHPERMRENYEIFDFYLSDDDLAAIERMNNGTRLGPDPDTAG